MLVIYHELDRWPYVVTPVRKDALFSAFYATTTDQITSEIDLLGCDRFTVGGFAPATKTRRDGWPAADCRPSHPGVAITFTCRFGQVTMATDQFTDWKDNLRGIALTLQSLRAIGRYGTAPKAEQYRGFLPGPAPVAPATALQAIPEALLAAEVLLLLGEDEEHKAEDLLRDLDLAERTFRRAAIRTHPDQGGTSILFRRAQSAITVLRSRKAV
jgi:hypothetical protein